MPADTKLGVGVEEDLFVTDLLIMKGQVPDL